jgi:hypothetical protein
MKYVIRSTDQDGARVGVDKIEEKKKAAREKIYAAGLQCLEYKALLGYENAQGQPTHEEVTIIEAISGLVYV